MWRLFRQGHGGPSWAERVLTTFLLLSFIQVHSVRAEPESGLVLEFHDQQGKPLADVVVSVRGTPVRKAPAGNIPVAVMDQVNKQFRPSVLIVQQGQRVSFPNSDNIRHHVYSFSSPKIFEIRLYANTPKEPVLFDQPGLVVLGCNIHDQMVGYIYVSDGDDTFISNGDGRIRIPDLPAASTLSVWHPRLSLNENERQTLTLQQLNTMPRTDGHIQITLSLAVAAPEQQQEGQGFGNKLRR